MFKERLQAFSQSIGLPKSNAYIDIPIPPNNQWEYFYTAPNNGTVFFFATLCYSVCVTNDSTSIMQYYQQQIGTSITDLSFCVRVKKGDKINLYYRADQVPERYRCRFVPDTNC